MSPSAPAAETQDFSTTGMAAISSFALRDVRLLDGPFRHAQQMTARYLRTLDPDRLLHNFRVNAGLKPRAPIYGGWESEATWADINCHGHTLGHYLSGCAMMHAATGEGYFAARARYVVDELAACQRASGSGLVCAFPDGPRLVARLIAGEDIPGVPWYTLHKVLAGLRDADQHAAVPGARAVLVRFADWCVAATRELSDGEFEHMLRIEHGGMNELFADLHAMTGTADYLTLAERFSHKALRDPLVRGRDHLDGLHANTQIPKVVGFQRLAEVGGHRDNAGAAHFFWETVTETRTLANGGHGDHEHFQPIAHLDRDVFSAKASETCGIYNMLRLTRMLFMQSGEPRYADFFEQALYNGILASQDPDSGMVTYFQGNRPGYPKLYCTPEDSFWCCTGSGMESHAKYGESIYFQGKNALHVNLFIPSVLNWREQGVTLTQSTRFPDEATTTLHLTMKKPARFALHLRHPGWSRSARVLLNGTEIEHRATPGGTIVVEREWQGGDRIELRLEMAPHAVPLPATPGTFALACGPVLLAGDCGNAGMTPGSDIVVNERKYGEYLARDFTAPHFAKTAQEVAKALTPGNEPLTFSVTDAVGAQVTLKPYFRLHHRRYVTYWQTRA